MRRTWRHRALRVAVPALMALAVACAPKSAPTTVFTPRYPDLPVPSVPTGLGPASAARAHDEAWQVLQTGNLDDAQRRFQSLLQQSPEFFPSQAALALLEFVRKDYVRAVERFDAALSIDADYLPALLGKGDALIAAERLGEAVVALERVVELDPARAELRQRIGVLRFRGTQDTIARAQQLERERKWPEARTAYLAAVAMAPDTAFLLRGLAEVEAQLGDRAAAVEHLRKAVEVEPAESAAYTRLAALLEELGNDTEALAVLVQLQNREPSASTESRIDAIRERIALAKLPEQYRTVGQTPAITRGELATLVGVRLRPLLDAMAGSGAVVVTDVRGHWAETWIAAVTSRRVLEPFANHTFQPDTALTRSDLAAAVSVLLRAIGNRQTQWWQQWQQRRTTFADVDTRHLSYPAAALAVSAEVLAVGEGRTFRPTRSVSGAEAVQAIDRLVNLAVKAGFPSARRGGA